MNERMPMDHLRNGTDKTNVKFASKICPSGTLYINKTDNIRIM